MLHRIQLIQKISSHNTIIQVMLVGHSAGGLSVTQACLKFPKKIRLAVYVAATMLPLGFRTHEDFQHVIISLFILSYLHGSMI